MNSETATILVLEATTDILLLHSDSTSPTPRMENTASKPVILKAGVPLAVTVAGFIYAWIMAKKSLSKASSLSLNDVNSTENKSHLGITGGESGNSLASIEDEGNSTLMDESVLAESIIPENPFLEQEMTCLRGQIEDMQMREFTLRLKFDEYCDLKEQECVLGEIRNTLSLQTARVELLDREISSMETENKRLEGFVVQYLRVVEQIECWKSDNRKLQRKFRKLLRKLMALSQLAKDQALMIRAEEAEILRSHDVLQTKIGVIDKLEDKIRELKRALGQMQDEKNELLKRLDTTEKSYASKVMKPMKNQIVAGDVSREDYNQVMKELEQIKKERADEVNELISLRWTNACLKHELTRHHEQQNHDRDNNNTELEHGGSDEVIHYDSEHELHGEDLLLEEEQHHNVLPPFSAVHHSHGAGSKRRKLLRRLKRWVEGGEKGKT